MARMYKCSGSPLLDPVGPAAALRVVHAGLGLRVRRRLPQGRRVPGADERVAAAPHHPHLIGRRRLGQVDLQTSGGNVPRQCMAAVWDV